MGQCWGGLKARFRSYMVTPTSLVIKFIDRRKEFLDTLESYSSIFIVLVTSAQYCLPKCQPWGTHAMMAGSVSLAANIGL